MIKINKLRVEVEKVKEIFDTKAIASERLGILLHSLNDE